VIATGSNASQEPPEGTATIDLQLARLARSSLWVEFDSLWRRLRASPHSSILSAGGLFFLALWQKPAAFRSDPA